LKVCHKEWEQGFSERLEVRESLEGIRPFEGIEGRQEAKYLGSLKESIVTRDYRRTSFVERDTLVSCAEDLRERNRWLEFSEENLRSPVSR
jgi:hypothetical protein